MTVPVATAAFVAVYMLSFWVASLIKRDASIVDVGWGPGFAGVALVAFLTGAGDPGRRWLALALTAVWGLRLGLYLLWRNWGEPEDHRYQAMRRAHGERFPLVSLATVFGLQGVLLWVVSLPVQMAMTSAAALGWLDAVAVVLWSVGMVFEGVGDWQLARFKADPGNRGEVMDRGLWRYTRHPNYFGDFCVWWGLYLVALAAGAWWTVIGPATMSFLLMKVSGVPMLERTIAKRRPAYESYARRTSAFFPRPPAA